MPPTPTPTRRQMMFVVADLEKHTVKVIPEDRVKDEGDDVDILLPLIHGDEIRNLPRRAARDFDNNLGILVDNLKGGTLPYDETIDTWLKNLGIVIFEDEIEGEAESDVEGDASNDNPETFGQDMFVSGFQAGVTFALGNLERLIPAPMLPTTAQAPGKFAAAAPNVATPKPSDRAVRLMRLVKSRKTNPR